eukprot:1142799-Pelagomonas_calceolata.AAC.7
MLCVLVHHVAQDTCGDTLAYLSVARACAQGRQKKGTCWSKAHYRELQVWHKVATLLYASQHRLHAAFQCANHGAGWSTKRICDAGQMDPAAKTDFQELRIQEQLSRIETIVDPSPTNSFIADFLTFHGASTTLMLTALAASVPSGCHECALE